MLDGGRPRQHALVGCEGDAAFLLVGVQEAASLLDGRGLAAGMVPVGEVPGGGLSCRPRVGSDG